jgi:hypothetical protein
MFNCTERVIGEQTRRPASEGCGAGSTQAAQKVATRNRVRDIRIDTLTIV